MGKQKDFRHVHHISHKKKDKKIDKTSRSSCQENYLKNVEVSVQAELEAAATSKKFSRKFRKELDRYPLLAKAAVLGCERVVDSILEAGENANVQIPDGRTPLILAVENGYPGIVQKLLKKGADPRLLRKDGRNALMIAVAKNDNPSFTLLWNYWDKSNFCELNHTDSHGYTALTIAVELGHAQFTNFLLSLNGVELDKQTAEGKTALMFAVSAGQVNVVQKLLSSGSDFTLEDKDGATAICLAISHNHHEIKELFYEFLDSKLRDVYVKKRIEILTRPRNEEISYVTAFYKDVLFRVLLEVRRRFDDSINLLEKYRVFVGLYKCLDTHSHDTELLRTGFHLTACLIYDKAEYSRYIAEELAEQYISTKFADFTLKVMQNHRLKSMTDIRGAAFLCIHAGTQCRSGKTWLKSNYFQILPFVNEFKVILYTLTFWAEGESTKAKIMFDRFVEIFTQIEKDIKACSSDSPEAKNAAIEPNTDQGSADTHVATLKSKSIDSDVSLGSEWQVVSRATSKKGTKPLGNPSISSPPIRKDNRKKSKKIKLKTKLQNKIAAKKIGQRQNMKFSAEFGRLFPNLPSSGTITSIGYADALKKNLRSEEILNQSQAKEKINLSKDTCALLPNNQVLSKGKIYSLSEIELDYDIERSKKKSALNFAAKEKISLLKSREYDELKERGRQEESNAYAEKKNQISNQNNQNEFPELVSSTSDAPTKNGHKKQSKAFRDILEALGLKTGFDQVETDEIRNIPKNESEISGKYLCEYKANEERENRVSDEIIYPDFLKCTLDTALKNTENNSLKSTNVDHEKENIQNGDKEIDKDVVKVPIGATKELTIDYEHNNSKEKCEKTQNVTGNEQEKSSPNKKSVTQTSSPEMQDYNERLKDISETVTKDSHKKSHKSNLIISLKRKNPETYFRDLSFNCCREEVRDVKEDSLVHLYCTFECGYKLSSHSTMHNEIENFSKRSINKNKTVILHEIKGRSNERKCNFNANFNACRWPLSEFQRPNLTSSKSITKFYKTSSTYQNIDFQRYIETSLEIPENNLMLSEIKEDRCIFGKSKSVFDFVINGNFSNFDLELPKYTKIPKFSGKLFSVYTLMQIVPDITLANIQKFIFLSKRLIFYQVMDQPHLSVLYMKTHPRLPKSSILCPRREVCVTESKNLQNVKCYHQENIRRGNNKNEFAPKNNYKILREFKSEIGKIISQLSSWYDYPPKKDSRNLRKKATNESKELRKMRQQNEELTIPKETKNCSFNFCCDSYSFKPDFVNCERKSRWYEKLHGIQSCIPLGAFFLEYGETLQSECFLHEMISGNGKVVFSSKEEHTLKQGDFGTYIGLISNGNPVVVKMFQKTDSQIFELLSSKRQLNHKNIVTFYFLCNPPNDQRMFTVTELIEYSLPEYMKTRMIHLDKKYLINDLVEAIQYLHRMQIVHGFLKPTNVMVTADDRLKVSDFYQMGVMPSICGIVCKNRKKYPAPIGTPAVSDFSWRPYELITETMEKDVRAVLTKASDIQMTGMLIYYILSEGKHPFGSSDLRCQENIRDGCPEFGPRPSDIESRDLVQDMIKRMPSQRPNIHQVAKHPYLWNIVRRLQFLVDVARKIEFFIWKPTKIAEALQDSCIEARDWTFNIHPEILMFVSKWMHKDYNNNYADLLHFIMSINDNFEIMPQDLKSYMGHPAFFISRLFPTFFMSVYCVMRDNPFVQQQMALQVYF